MYAHTLRDWFLPLGLDFFKFIIVVIMIVDNIMSSLLKPYRKGL